MKNLIVALILLITAFVILFIYFGSVSYEPEVEGCDNYITAMQHFRNLGWIVAGISVLLWFYAFFKPYAYKIFRNKIKKTSTILIWHILASVFSTSILMILFYLTNISNMRRMIFEGLRSSCKEVVEPSAVFIFKGLPFPFSLILEICLFIILFVLFIAYTDLLLKKIRK